MFLFFFFVVINELYGLNLFECGWFGYEFEVWFEFFWVLNEGLLIGGLEEELDGFWEGNGFEFNELEEIDGEFGFGFGFGFGFWFELINWWFRFGLVGFEEEFKILFWFLNLLEEEDFNWLLIFFMKFLNLFFILFIFVFLFVVNIMD